MFLTSCDACGFECDACYVDGTWQFLCDLCDRIQRFELESRITVRDMSAADYLAEKMTALVAFESTMERARALLASIETNTARVNAARV